MKQKIYILLPWLLLILWCVLIFSFSARDAHQSTRDSDRIIFSFAKNIDKELHATLTVVVRKSAHFFLYFVLGVFSLLSVNTLSVNKRNPILSLLFCFLYATSDEIHQWFVPGRSCAFIDVLIDTSASFIAIMLLHHIIKRCQKRKQHQ